jgi:hypothetical protein
VRNFVESDECGRGGEKEDFAEILLPNNDRFVRKPGRKPGKPGKPGQIYLVDIFTLGWSMKRFCGFVAEHCRTSQHESTK